MQINDKEKYNLENFQTHLNVALDIEKSNDSWETQDSY